MTKSYAINKVHVPIHTALTGRDSKAETRDYSVTFIRMLATTCMMAVAPTIMATT